MMRAIQRGKKRFAADPNFRPDLVPGYFVLRPEDEQDDSTLLRRIIAAYQRAKVKQRTAGEAFNVSNEWLAIYELGELLRSSANQVVVKLGGGFGGLAYYLLRDHPQVTYVDFDLPEATALASYYLMKSLPDIPIRLYGEIELSSAVLGTPGVIMMPSFEIVNMPSKSAAVSFNSYSLAEMSPVSIQVYVDEVTRLTAGYFLHVNHNRRARLGADNFGIEERGFKLLNRQLSGWTLGINTSSDEYEYLYQAS
jgi:putative sugar O-methyltransferase